MRSPLLLLAAGLAACTAAPRSVELGQGPLYREIARLEDLRESGGDRLTAFLRHPSRDLRVRAARALGRLPFPEQGAAVTGALLEGLKDGDRRVRAEVAFALGMRGDPAAGEALLERVVDPDWSDADTDVRARCVEAVSKLPRPDLRLRTLEALSDEAEAVRIEAAEGAHRWSREEPHAGQVDRLLLEHLEAEEARNVVAMILFSLQRRRAPTARGTFLRYADSRQVLERMWSIRGLAALEPGNRALAALALGTRDPDWRVAYEATVGLGSYDLGVETATLLTATGHRQPHVRRAAWEALARRLARIDDPRALRHATAWRVAFDERAAQRDPSVEVRAAFGAALAHYQRLTDSTPLTLAVVQARLAAGTATPEEWVAFAGALGEIGPREPEVGRILELLATVPDLRVAGAALSALGNLPDERTRAFLHAALADPDNGLRLAAVTALQQMPDPSDVEPLGRTFETSTGDIGAELRFNVLRALGAVGGERALEVVSAGLADPDWFVRRVAREQLEAHWPDEPVAAAPPPTQAPGPGALAPGQDPPVYRRNPRVRIETSRGDLVFELFPREAPFHVYSFLTLVDADHYDGTLFHRVVPNFVIQGGDYRGDGNGGTTYRGEDSLRHEIGPRKFVRGSLGMPRNEDPDSGGSQIFVTHRPTPHLDGRYTIFGQLRDGFDVLDELQVGDRILDVRQIRRR